MQIVILSALGGYFALMVLIGLWAARNQTHEGFVIGSRNVGYIPTMGSVAASTRDGGGIIFWVGAGATILYGGFWLFIGIAVALVLFAVFGPKIRTAAAEKDYLTIGELVRNELGPVTEKTGAFIILCLSLLFVAIQLYVSGNLLAEVLSVPSWVGVFSAAAIVGFYMFFGGYGAVVRTDAIQFFLMLSLIILSFSFPPPKEEVLNLGSFFEIGLKDGFALFIFGAFYMLGGGDTWQRIFSARDKKVIRASFPLAGIFLVLMTLSLLFLGMSARPLLTGDIPSGDVFFSIFTQGVFPVPVLAFIAVVAMAITMSTLDTFCYLFTATLAKNFLPKNISGTRERYVRFSKIIFILILATMSILALMISDIIQFMFNAASLITILAPVHVFAAAGLTHKAPRLDILMAGSVMASLFVYLVMFSLGYMEDFIVMLVPAGLSFVLCTISLLGFKYVMGSKNV